MDIEEKVIAIIKEQTGTEPTIDSEISSEDIDSIDHINIVMCCEEEFSIEIADEELEAIMTVSDLIKLIIKDTNNDTE